MQRILITIVALSMCSCLGKRTPSSEKVTEPTLEMESMVLESGEYSGIFTLQNLCIQSEEDWEKCWKNIHSQSIPVPKLPVINFEKYILIACFMGSQNSGGYSINIDQVVTDGEGLRVRVLHTTPGKNCIRTMAMTQPYIVIRMAKPAKADCQFEIVEKVLNC
ncbi:MAG: protease complex subunit PrcB family protein [Bacteroidota bacterium]